MKSLTFFAFMLVTFLSFNTQAQERLIATTPDQSLNFSLIGKVEHMTSHQEAWIKVAHTNTSTTKNTLSNFRQNKIEIRSNHNQSSEGYDKYLYSMDLYQVDCKANKFRVVESDDYDADGKLLSKGKTPDAEWIDMIYPSIFEKVGKVVCSN